MSKPEIRYSDMGTCLIGRGADVYLRDHPSVKLPEGGAWVTTSEVLGFVRQTMNGPVFETRNTIYLPYPADGTLPVRKTWDFLNATEKQS